MLCSLQYCCRVQDLNLISIKLLGIWGSLRPCWENPHHPQASIVRLGEVSIYNWLFPPNSGILAMLPISSNWYLKKPYLVIMSFATVIFENYVWKLTVIFGDFCNKSQTFIHFPRIIVCLALCFMAEHLPLNLLLLLKFVQVKINYCCLTRDVVLLF